MTTPCSCSPGACHGGHTTRPAGPFSGEWTDAMTEEAALAMTGHPDISEDCRNGHHSWSERGHGPCSACGEPSPPPVLPQLECGCLPDVCHGEHTITRLSAVQSWMLAHDWTELSEGDSGWMWQHTTGRKVAVFRDLTDPHTWEGLIGRLAVAHARHPSDIEREIRRGEPPVLLADEQLRRITEYVHPDEGTAYVRPWLHSMAVELLAARARIAELEADDEPDDTAIVKAAWDEHADAVDTLDRIRTALAGHPRCEEHPEGDVIKCGWKRAVASVQAAVDAAPAQREPSGYVVGWEETEGRVTIALDESEPHPGGGPDRFAYTDLGDARMFLAEISPEDPDTTFHVYELREVGE